MTDGSDEISIRCVADEVRDRFDVYTKSGEGELNLKDFCDFEYSKYTAALWKGDKALMKFDEVVSASQEELMGGYPQRKWLPLKKRKEHTRIYNSDQKNTARQQSGRWQAAYMDQSDVRCARIRCKSPPSEYYKSLHFEPNLMGLKADFY